MVTEIEEVERSEKIEPKTQASGIDFDFLTQKEQVLANFDKTLVVLMKSNRALAPDFQLAGKAMMDYVSMAASCCKQIVLDEVEEGQIMQAVRPYVADYEMVVVLFSDTPLLQKSTFAEILQRFGERNVMKLPRGWVFKGDFLRGAYMLIPSPEEQFEGKDFFVVDSAAAASFAFKILQKRIISYHKQNGVFFFGEESIFVDADVEIEAGAKIFGQNTIKGQTYIGKNAVLQCGNYVEDAIICDGACVCQSFLKSSKVEKGQFVGPFEKLVGQVAE